MIVKPTVVELLEKAENRYSLVIATAKRARQISSGSRPMTEKDDVSPVTLAADEIEEEKIKIYNQAEWNKEVEERKNNLQQSETEETESSEESEQNSDVGEEEKDSENE